MRWIVVSIMLLASWHLASASASASADVTVAAWNVDGVEKNIEVLRANAADMQADIGPIDILIIDEVIAEGQVAVITGGFGLPHWAISDFASPVSMTKKGYKSLEVAFITRFPMEGVAEWDTTGQLPHGDGYVLHVSSEVILGEEYCLDVSLDLARPLSASCAWIWKAVGRSTPATSGNSCPGSDHRPFFAISTPLERGVAVKSERLSGAAES